MNSSKSAWFVVVFGLVCAVVSLTVGGVLATQPIHHHAGTGCIFKWVGPATGWVLVSDGCDGHCTAPTYSGLYVGQEVIVSCDPPR